MSSILKDPFHCDRKTVKVLFKALIYIRGGISIWRQLRSLPGDPLPLCISLLAAKESDTTHENTRLLQPEYQIWTKT